MNTDKHSTAKPQLQHSNRRVRGENARQEK